ncbi:Gfo/Idh/MocA family oxidoreductase [Nitrosopumilus sp.]|uniref:Gfo/Idh/MocA family protein n=1 Tax=Nitrosopumilus sp. TaxID=2024843 RepID=UPI00247BA5E5|nr:Gfo/Idh/MocA family oxidoreductase [Nitrosopumilus sp.]MCV0430386.1 Gfo/Idh/MocA family oxidoreductase [Nitrosopumilus sp.]
MKFLIVGLGSMGNRRIRNLLKLNCKDIIGFDPKLDRITTVSKKFNIPTFLKIDDALREEPHVMIISTPPDLHKKYAELAIKNNLHFFMEVNMFSKDTLSIIKKLKNKNIIGAPSCTMQFHPVVKSLQKLIKKNSIGDILAIEHHTGQYLPSWHPWEKIDDFYVSKKETGGAREMVPVELVWLIHLFSNVKSVIGIQGKISSLPVDIDDFYHIFLEFKNKISCHLLIDVFSQPTFRETKIVGESGSILCDFFKNTISINNGKGWKTQKLLIGKYAKGYAKKIPESMYEEEIKAFINAIKGLKKYPHTLKNELNLLNILDAIEKSNKTGKKIETIFI